METRRDGGARAYRALGRDRSGSHDVISRATEALKAYAAATDMMAEPNAPRMYEVAPDGLRVSYVVEIERRPLRGKTIRRQYVAVEDTDGSASVWERDREVGSGKGKGWNEWFAFQRFDRFEHAFAYLSNDDCDGCERMGSSARERLVRGYLIISGRATTVRSGRKYGRRDPQRVPIA